MRAYHLTKECWTIESLKKQRLKISLLNDMNDPFELLGVNLKKKADRELFHELKEEMNRTIGVLCFSRSWSNPVLWSHYADKHHGICLGFDLLDEWTKEVTYTASRLKAELEQEMLLNNQDGFGLKLLTTKYEHWQYENEVRLIIELKHAEFENGKYFLPYSKALQLKEVITGPRNALKKNDINLVLPERSIIKSRLAFNSYKVVRNLLTT
jgi:hypothetical protein